jgi:hypothetical protein
MALQVRSTAIPFYRRPGEVSSGRSKEKIASEGPVDIGEGYRYTAFVTTVDAMIRRLQTGHFGGGEPGVNPATRRGIRFHAGGMDPSARS